MVTIHHVMDEVFQSKSVIQSRDHYAISVYFPASTSFNPTFHGQNIPNSFFGHLKWSLPDY